MADFPALPLWTDSYLADTTHLGAEEHGCYLLLLMAMWRSPTCSLTNETRFLSRVARVTEKRWAERIWPSLSGFFVVTKEAITQKRLTKEREKVEAVRAIRREAAAKSHAPKPLPPVETGPANAPANDLLSISISIKEKEELLRSSKKDRADAKAPSPKTPRASRLPADFVCSIEEAMATGLTEAQSHDQAARFKDYWPAQPGSKGLKLDWPATWRNWCRRAADDLAKRGGSPPGRPEKYTRFDALLDFNREARERDAAEQDSDFPSLDALVAVGAGQWPH